MNVFPVGGLDWSHLGVPGTGVSVCVWWITGVYYLGGAVATSSGRPTGYADSKQGCKASAGEEDALW